MRASSGALRQCTRRQPLSTHFMPIAWHYISGQFSIPAPRKPQKSAIFLPQPPPKLFNFSQGAAYENCTPAKVAKEFNNADRGTTAAAAAVAAVSLAPASRSAK